MGKIGSHPLALEARVWIGTPYQHQGRGMRGIDAFGLVKAVYGLKTDVSPGDYSPVLAKGEPFLDAIGDNINLRGVPWLDIEPGDLLCFRLGRETGGCVNHFGVMARYDTMIHSYLSQSVRETHLGSWWMRRMAYTYRI